VDGARIIETAQRLQMMFRKIEPSVAARKCSVTDRYFDRRYNTIDTNDKIKLHIVGARQNADE